MPRFRLKTDYAVDVYKPAGEYDSLTVQPAGVVEAPGAMAAVQPDDAYVVEMVDGPRAWAKAIWELVEDPKPAAAKSAAATVKEN